MIVTGYLLDKSTLESLKVDDNGRVTKYTGLILICYASLRSEMAFRTKPIAVSGQKNLGEFIEYIKRD